MYDSLMNRKVNNNQLTSNKTITWICGCRYMFEIVNYDIHVYICTYTHIITYILMATIYKKLFNTFLLHTEDSTQRSV